MTPIELAKQCNFSVINEGEGNDRQIDGIYCCDLLSVVMGRAKANDLWITVMGNLNTVAVAVLSDVSCILLAEGITMDDTGIQKAKQQDVCVLATEQPVFEAAMCATKVLSL